MAESDVSELLQEISPEIDPNKYEIMLSMEAPLRIEARADELDATMRVITNERENYYELKGKDWVTTIYNETFRFWDVGNGSTYYRFSVSFEVDTPVSISNKANWTDVRRGFTLYTASGGHIADFSYGWSRRCVRGRRYLHNDTGMRGTNVMDPIANLGKILNGRVEFATRVNWCHN